MNEKKKNEVKEIVESCWAAVCEAEMPGMPPMNMKNPVSGQVIFDNHGLPIFTARLQVFMAIVQGAMIPRKIRHENPPESWQQQDGDND